MGRKNVLSGVTEIHIFARDKNWGAEVLLGGSLCSKI